MVGKKDICPVTKPGTRGGEWHCSLPRKHIKLLLVRPGDRRSKFVNMASPHVFKSFHPYPNQE